MAELLVQLYYEETEASSLSLDVNGVREDIISASRYFEDFSTSGGGVGSLEEQIEGALEKALTGAKFIPNASQKQAITWALKRKVALIRGPPGTGKTRGESSVCIMSVLNIATH